MWKCEPGWAKAYIWDTKISIFKRTSYLVPIYEPSFICGVLECVCVWSRCHVVMLLHDGGMVLGPFPHYSPSPTLQSLTLR